MSTRYSFRTRWSVDASPERSWQELVAVATGRSDGWWRSLRVTAPATRAEPGAEIGARVRAPFGYSLRFVLRVTAVDKGRAIDAVSVGDLEGRGRVEVHPRGSGSELRFEWDVTARRRWMIAAGPVLRRVFALGHRIVMRAGERGLRRAVRDAPSGARKPANPGA
ncbi:hypothetical protein [Microbacterium paludicola]|uniref:hypothetical protein n=1 Tax=Microbacterium paludicola TaxID=300019 RepID=UPI0031D1F575